MTNEILSGNEVASWLEAKVCDTPRLAEPL